MTLRIKLAGKCDESCCPMIFARIRGDTIFQASCVTGDLPELTNEIIQYLRNDISTLYSCIFVNRLWCRLAIPLLWEDPFSIPTQHYHCIEIY
ncbi:hypothetical protein GLOIN_2v1767282 [Rhizophagus irregularis DAOM 181602=DAOM 197198]|uniref:F-box domain-containing protein n=1 Tax=Rhizophagus irregularis (strain DAOM 181602 / DAOM 197198 / MUCL 43194) TaxID=747089 RepID=U9UDQ5_RHIID|nr:hypothetical protein GLOIN_2v1767282 [Rhizophagus irregularis DAOM 181602=DAOM 197198]